MLRRINVSSKNNQQNHDSYDEGEEIENLSTIGSPSSNISEDALDEEFSDNLDNSYDDSESDNDVFEADSNATVSSARDKERLEKDSDGDAHDDMFGMFSEITPNGSSSKPSSSEDNSFELPSLQGNSFLGTRSSRSEREAKPTQSRTSRPRVADDEAGDEENEMSLLEWGEGFRYQPAVEYLRLKRLHPKIWEGIQIAGWICDIYEPIDEQWLAEHWGGGTYRLEAVQLDKSAKTRTKDSRIVTISGIPTHFADEQGNPHRLPTSAKITRSSSDMLMGRNRGLQKFNQRSSDFESDYPPSSSSAPVSNTASASAVELLRLAQANNNERREDSKSLEILRLAQNDFQSQMSQTAQIQQDLYKEMLENQRRELERMRAEQEKVVQNAQRPLSEALNLVSNRAEKESLSLKEQMSRVEQEHRDRVDSLRDELNKQFNNFMREKEDLKNAHRSQVELIIKDYSERERLLIKEHNERERIYRDNLEKSLQESSSKERILRDSIDALTRTNQDKIEQITILHNEKIESLNKAFSEKNEGLSRSYNEKIDSLTRMHNEKVENISRTYNEKIDDIVRTHQARETEWRQREIELKQQSDTNNSNNFGQVRIQMDSLRDNHQSQISNLQNEHQRKLGDLYKEMSSLREDSRERENNIRREYSEREQRLTAEYHKNLSDARNDYSDRLETIKREYDQRERDRKETFERIERELKDNLTKTERELKDQLITRERELKDRHDSKIGEMLTQQTARENELRTNHDTREKQIRDNFDEKERALRESLEARYENTIKGLQDRVDFLKSNSDDKIQQFLKDADRKEDQLKTVLESSHKAQISVIESERNRLRDEVTALRAELREAKEKSFTQTDPIAKLAEIKSFKENLKSYGFLPKDDDEERGLSKRSREDEDDDDYQPKRTEAPKDFLGKIAHYGPSIAQNFLGPVLARVDNATAVANEALSAQKIELQNQAKALELQRKQLETEQVAAENAQKEAFAVSQQMQMQQRLQEKKAILDEKRRAREQQQIMLRQEQVSVPMRSAEQMIPRRSPEPIIEDDVDSRPPVRAAVRRRTLRSQDERSVVNLPQSKEYDQSVSSPPPTPSQPQEEPEMSGYERLTDFLNESINDQLAADEVSNKIKTASMLGLIPKGLLQETLADSFEVLYSNVTEVATRKGYSKLVSPRGLNFCQQVYTALKK